MLVLKRKDGSAVFVGHQVIVRVIKCNRGNVVLGIEAPPNVVIVRDELAERDTQLEPPEDPKVG